MAKVDCLLLYLVATYLQSAETYVPGCQIGYNLITDKCYRFHQTAMSWSDAMNVCEGEDATLASVSTNAEYTMLLSHINSNYPGRYWTSGKLTNGVWKWKNTDTKVSNTWFGRNPVTHGNYCVYFCSYTNRYWDGECSLSKKFICEKPEEIDVQHEAELMP